MFFKACQVLCIAIELQTAQISLCWSAKPPANTLSYGSEEAASFQASTSTLEGAAWIQFWLQELNFASLFPIHPTQQPGLLVDLFLVIVFPVPQYEKVNLWQPWFTQNKLKFVLLVDTQSLARTTETKFIQTSNVQTQLAKVSSLGSFKRWAWRKNNTCI